VLIESRPALGLASTTPPTLYATRRLLDGMRQLITDILGCFNHRSQ